MKSFKIILATLAATAALVACTKETTPPDFENDKVNPEGTRVIAVSFAPQTKTELDGFQPKFVDNDSILISNGVAIDTCEVKVESEVATISTNLTGPLTAVYPYKAAKMNDNNHNLIDTVLVSTEQDGTFASASICMASMTGENEESLSFENKTAVFCIKPAAGASPEYVEVSAEGFDIANHIPTGSTNTDSSAIRVAPVTTDSVYVSILVPNGLKVNNLKFSDGTKEKAITTGAQATEEIAAGTLYTVTATGWESPEADIPGALKGKFSIGASKQVQFSQGNLVATIDADGSPTAWKFHAHQYDTLGCGGANTSIGTAAGDIDLFGWSTANTTYGINTSDSDVDYSGNFIDWGKAIEDSNTWRTLTTEEWQYLFSYTSYDEEMNPTGMDYRNDKREGKYKYGVTVCGKANCVVLLPDVWDESVISLSSFANQATYNNESTTPTWEQMENAGAVCLPAAGYREGTSAISVGDYGIYWSSTARGLNDAHNVCFYSEAVLPFDGGARFFGCSVRLVTDVSAAPAPDPESPEEAFIVPTDEENGINPTSFCVKSSDRDFTYWIGRTASEKACTVSIINHSDSRFTVPSSVTFQAGEAQAPLTITFSDTLPEEDCTVSFEIGGEYAAGSGSFTGVLKYIPFYKRVCGNYTSDEIHDYFGENVTFNFNVVPSEDDSTGKVIFENLDPSSFGSGGTAENGYNKPYGLLDEENSMITIPVQGFGYESWDFLGFDAPTLDESEYYYTPIYIRFDGNDTLTFTNAWGIITGPEAWEYWSLYNGGFSCKKNTGTVQQNVSKNAAPKPLSLHKLGKTYIDARK